MRQQFNKRLGIVSILATSMIWQLASSWHWVNPVFLLGPLAVLEATWTLLFSGELPFDILTSVWRILAGFSLSVLISLPLGIWIATSSTVHRFFSPLLNISKYLPVVAFVPLSIIWFGIGDSSKIFLLALGTIPYLTSLIVSTFERIPTQIIETARTLGLSHGQIIRHVILPFTAPRILDALRVSMAICWTYLTVAEIFAATSGLGHLIVQSQRYLKTEYIFVGIISISVLGLITDALFFKARKKFFSWEGEVLHEKNNHL